MRLSVDIDANSGFCAGVTRAIRKAEEQLDGPEGRLFSLGSIVHNDAELTRLEAKGLVTIDKEDLDEMQDAEGETLLIRAHGEPPATYEKAHSLHFNIIDCTCPVVLKLQESIREAYSAIKDGSTDGQIIIFGKPGHAEVLGLVGQAEGNATVIENMKMLEEAHEESGGILIHLRQTEGTYGQGKRTADAEIRRQRTSESTRNDMLPGGHQT